MMKSTILLIGGAGFIGSNLISSFIKEGKYKIIVFENEGADLKRLDIHRDQIEVITGDMADSSFFVYIIEQFKVSIVIHLVSTLLPNSSLDDYLIEFDRVIKPTIKIINICANLNVRFVYFSSGGVIYGNSDRIVHSETDPIAPISYYGLSKCNLENIILIEHRRNNLSYLILRPSNPYGHGQRLYGKQGLIAVAIGKIMRGEQIEIYGDGKNVRDYIYIDDLCDCCYRLIEDNVVNEIFNIGSGKGYSNSEIISIINDISLEESNIVYSENRSSDVKSVILCIDKLSRFINFELTDIRTGIKRFYTESTVK